MGHIRLGNLPKRQSQQVVELLDSGAGTLQIAAATVEAAKRGLEKPVAIPHSFIHFGFSANFPPAHELKILLQH
jgi:hypothetical protein